jgi:hypothetical protein
VYLSCKAVWGTGANTPITPCLNVVGGVSAADIQGPLYGFIPTNGVTVTITTATENGFGATAQNPALFDPGTASITVFTMLPNGTISNTGNY